MNKLYRALFWVLIALSIFLIIKSSNDPIPYWIRDNRFAYVLENFSIGNTVISGLAIGYLISAIFYCVVVYIPDYLKKKTLKANLSKTLSFIFEAFSGNPFHWSKHIIYCKPLSDFSPEFEQYLDKAKNRRLSELQIKAIIESANEALPTYEHLVAGALQLSSGHALIWLSLTNSIRQISTLYPFTSDTKGERDLGIFDLNLMEFVEYTIQWYKLASNK